MIADVILTVVVVVYLLVLALVAIAIASGVAGEALTYVRKSRYRS